MKAIHHFALTAAWVLLSAASSRAEVQVRVGHNDVNHAAAAFTFDNVPPPSRNDAATGAVFTVVYGDRDQNANDVNRLHDGRVPDWEDQPGMNFAFDHGDGGRISVDLGRAIDVGQVNTYSWHPHDRGPQVYKLYACDGGGPGFDPKPEKGKDPLGCGWTRIATVDTRPATGDPGGQYGVSISDPGGSLGHFRYLLLDISRTENTDDWGNTFYSEIDVVERNGPPPAPAARWSVAAADPPGDPMDWNPPESVPPIRERYPAKRYETLAKAALAKVDLEAILAPGRPVGGALVTDVPTDSPAAALGIHTGDILVSVDGIPLGTHGDDEDMNATRNGQDQRLVFWSPKGGQKVVTIKPGKIGIGYDGGWRLLDSYVRSADRDPKWDDDMFVATSTFKSDPNLAETALRHAQKAGYQGTMFTSLAARIAYAQYRFRDTVDFGWPMWSTGQRLNGDTVKMYNDAALLNFKLEQSLDLAARYPDSIDKDDEEAVQTLVTGYRAMPKSSLSNPLAELRNVRRTRCVKYEQYLPKGNRDYIEDSRWAVSTLNRPEPLSLDVPSGHYLSALLMPGFANAALAVHFKVHETDQNETEFGKCLCFGLFDASGSHPADHLPPDAVKISLMIDGPILVDAFGMKEINFTPARPPRAAANLEGTLRIVILHNRCEVSFDGDKRVFYGPVISDEMKRRYGIYFQAVGVSGRVLPPIWEKLEDPRPQPATQPTALR